MIKVRFTTWYWGNYCLATKAECENLPQGFELYNEELHGWKNSEEFKLKGQEEFIPEDYVVSKFNHVYNSSYVISYFKNLRTYNET